MKEMLICLLLSIPAFAQFPQSMKGDTLVRIPCVIVIGDSPPIANCYIYQVGTMPDSSGIVIWLDPLNAITLHSRLMDLDSKMKQQIEARPQLNKWQQRILETIAQDTTKRK